MIPKNSRDIAGSGMDDPEGSEAAAQDDGRNLSDGEGGAIKVPADPRDLFKDD
jgi:hypothetical protein